MPISLIPAALWQNCWPSPHLSFIFLLKIRENFWEIGRQHLSQPFVTRYLVAHVVYRLHWTDLNFFHSVLQQAKSKTHCLGLSVCVCFFPTITLSQTRFSVWFEWMVHSSHFFLWTALLYCPWKYFHLLHFYE